jgi:FMN-dependent NADH-azoreductase
MKLLHIVASPRLNGSNTLRIANSFLDAARAADPALEVETVDLFNEDLPAVAGSNIEAKYGLLMGQPIDRNHAESWGEIEREISRFLSADGYVITTPMWNFSVPYALKYYIDCIVQPGYTFRFNAQGYPEGLVIGKRMIVVSSSGSDYSEGSPMHALNFHEPYLRTILGFIGITDVSFVQGFAMDVPQYRAAALEKGIADAGALAWDDGWQRFEVAA